MSYSTSIIPDSPGCIGFSGFFGIVHPQDEKILEKIKGELPIFLNSKVFFPSAPFSMVP